MWVVFLWSWHNLLEAASISQGGDAIFVCLVVLYVGIELFPGSGYWVRVWLCNHTFYVFPVYNFLSSPGADPEILKGGVLGKFWKFTRKSANFTHFRRNIPKTATNGGWPPGPPGSAPVHVWFGVLWPEIYVVITESCFSSWICSPVSFPNKVFCCWAKT